MTLLVRIYFPNIHSFISATMFVTSPHFEVVLRITFGLYTDENHDSYSSLLAQLVVLRFLRKMCAKKRSFV